MVAHQSGDRYRARKGRLEPVGVGKESQVRERRRGNDTRLNRRCRVRKRADSPSDQFRPERTGKTKRRIHIGFVYEEKEEGESQRNALLFGEEIDRKERDSLELVISVGDDSDDVILGLSSGCSVGLKGKRMNSRSVRATS